MKKYNNKQYNIKNAQSLLGNSYKIFVEKFDRHASLIVLSAISLIVFIIYYLNYMRYDPVPGNNPKYPLGWWGWADQGNYLQGALDFANWQFEAASHFYPPFYTFLGSIFVNITPDHIYYYPNLFLLCGYIILFVLLMQKYIGVTLSLVALFFGIISSWVIGLQWLIPWTSTPTAFFLISGLILLDRQRIKDTEGSWTQKGRVLNSALFGLCIGMLLPTRPGDFFASSPLAVAYAALLLRKVFAGGLRDRTPIMQIAAGALAALVPIGLYAVFNQLVFGNLTGRYVAFVQHTGVFWTQLPMKFYSHILNSYDYYAEYGADWLSVIPINAFSLAFLAAALFVGPFVFRISSLVAWLALATSYAYSGTLPTGTFRYFNIHYFKWMLPVAIGVSLYFLIGVFSRDSARRKISLIATSIALAITLLALSVSTTATRYPLLPAGEGGNGLEIELPNSTIDYVDFLGATGGWTDISSAVGVTLLHDGKALISQRDYNMLNRPNGLRILFTKPVAGGHLQFISGDRIHLASQKGLMIEAVRRHFTLRLPWHSRSAPPSFYVPGSDVTFRDGGNAGFYLGKGWSGGEPWGRWIDGTRAEIDLSLPAIEDSVLRFQVQAFVVPERHPIVEAVFKANDCIIGNIQLTDIEKHDIELWLPKSCLDSSRAVHVVIENISAASPKSLLD